ncbi:hypothetical protein [Coleofasciculus sp. FACHB-SPT36]|uniref:hypothetical protein n=1 Tax=Coleofasciculus sp. FACHB-SPT36 TaxID=2692790 RepID=UPI00168BF56D|nr:hypothetical protein [Coleofasciculus sp. FACHB-SPT36]
MRTGLEEKKYLKAVNFSPVSSYFFLFSSVLSPQSSTLSPHSSVLTSFALNGR